MSEMDDSEQVSAKRSRQAAAALVDMTVLWLVRRARGAAAGRAEWVAPLATELVREQLRSPGQALLGLRTVDRRTGGRVALWRSLVLATAGAGQHVIAQRLRPPAPSPEQVRARERYVAEMAAVYERHPLDPDARSAERARLLEHAPSPIKGAIGPQAVANLAIGLARGRLRRRLAPTVEVVVRRSAHRP